MEHYEQYVREEISKQELRAALDAAHDAKAMLTKVMKQKAAYDKEYDTFYKLLFASDKRITLSEITDCIANSSERQDLFALKISFIAVFSSGLW